MKRNYPALASIALLAAMVITGWAFCVSNSSSMTGGTLQNQNYVVRRNVIKVHTDTGVVTLPGRADTWDTVESAIFVADGFAELQMVNNQASIWPISFE